MFYVRKLFGAGNGQAQTSQPHVLHQMSENQQPMMMAQQPTMMAQQQQPTMMAQQQQPMIQMPYQQQPMIQMPYQQQPMIQMPYQQQPIMQMPYVPMMPYQQPHMPIMVPQYGYPNQLGMPGCNEHVPGYGSNPWTQPFRKPEDQQSRYGPSRSTCSTWSNMDQHFDNQSAILSKVSNMELRHTAQAPDATASFRFLSEWAQGGHWGLSDTVARSLETLLQENIACYGQCMAGCDDRRGQYEATRQLLQQRGHPFASDKDMRAIGWVALHTPAAQDKLRRKFQNPALLDRFKLSPEDEAAVRQAWPLGTKYEEVDPEVTAALRGEVFV